MSDLVAVAYPDVATAREVVSNLGDAQKAHLIELEAVSYTHLTLPTNSRV